MNYRIFDCSQDCYVAKFKSQKEVILYIAQHDGGYDRWRGFWYCDAREVIGSAINMNGKDGRFRVDFHGNAFIQIRPFMVVDDDNRVIDIREWDIKKILESKNFVNYKIRKAWRMKTNHKRCYGHYRHPKTYQLRREFADRDMAKFMRPKLKTHIPDPYWVDSWAESSKSWKDQSKKKKQWM